MKRQTCPRCQRQSLIPTGAFWACGLCSYAITQAALLIDQADSQVRNRRGQADSQTGDNTTL
jgi:ribosomal protein L37AE/L43A